MLDACMVARQSHAPRSRRTGAPRTGFRWFIGLLLVAAVVIAARGFGDEARFTALLRDARPAWLLLLIAFQLATYVLLAEAWTLAIRRAGGSPPRAGVLVRVALAELFTDQALPSAGVAGTVLVLNSLRRRGVPAPAAGTAVVASLIGLYVAQLLAVVASIVVLFARHRLNHFSVVVSVIALLVALAVPSICVAIVAGALPRLPNRLQRLHLVRALRETIEQAPRDIVFEPRIVLSVSALRLGILLLDGATIAIGGVALGKAIPLDEAIAAFSLASVAGSVSFLPGALGSFELLATGLLVLCGMPLELSVSSVLLMRGFSFWLPMIPGVWFARSELRRDGEHQEQRPDLQASHG